MVPMASVLPSQNLTTAFRPGANLTSRAASQPWRWAPKVSARNTPQLGDLALKGIIIPLMLLQWQAGPISSPNPSSLLPFKSSIWEVIQNIRKIPDTSPICPLGSKVPRKTHPKTAHCHGCVLRKWKKQPVIKSRCSLERRECWSRRG